MRIGQDFLRLWAQVAQLGVTWRMKTHSEFKIKAGDYEQEMFREEETIKILGGEMDIKNLRRRSN